MFKRHRKNASAYCYQLINTFLFLSTFSSTNQSLLEYLAGTQVNGFLFTSEDTEAIEDIYFLLLWSRHACSKFYNYGKFIQSAEDLENWWSKLMLPFVRFWISNFRLASTEIIVQLNQDWINKNKCQINSVETKMSVTASSCFLFKVWSF